MSNDKTKGKSVFLRVDDKQLRILEAACKIRHGQVRGYMSDFVRYGALRFAKEIIEEERERRRK